MYRTPSEMVIRLVNVSVTLPAATAQSETQKHAFDPILVPTTTYLEPRTILLAYLYNFAPVRRVAFSSPHSTFFFPVVW